MSRWGIRETDGTLALCEGMTTRLDPSLLPTFLAVVDAGRISAAAKVLHLSQPAVTAQIRKIEDSLGASLFVRSVQGVVPTAAGVRLAAYAHRVQRLLDDATGFGGVVERAGGLSCGSRPARRSPRT